MPKLFKKKKKKKKGVTISQWVRKILMGCWLFTDDMIKVLIINIYFFSFHERIVQPLFLVHPSGKKRFLSPRPLIFGVRFVLPKFVKNEVSEFSERLCLSRRHLGLEPLMVIFHSVNHRVFFLTLTPTLTLTLLVLYHQDYL